MVSAKVASAGGIALYRDEPGLDDGSDSLSLQSRNGGHQNQVPIAAEPPAIEPHFQDEDDIPDVLGAPPAYTDHIEEQVRLLDQLPDENPHLLKPWKRSKGVDIVMDGRFDYDPSYMEDTLKRWARTPPAQLIHIRGTHTQTVNRNDKEHKETVTDFDLKLRLTEYLFNRGGTSSWAELVTADNNERTYRGGIFRTRTTPTNHAMEAGKPSLTEWCHRYCASHAELRTFRLTREVTGLDTTYLTEALTRTVRNTNYRGHVDISFPIENRAVEVYSSRWQNRWRHSGWVQLVFALTFFWLFALPYLFFATKKFQVVRARWPYSRPAADQPDGSQSGSATPTAADGNGASGRKVYATLSEKSWYERWAKTVEINVLNKTRATLTEEDRVHSARQAVTGSPGFDEVVSFFGASLRAFSEVNRQLGWGQDC